MNTLEDQVSDLTYLAESPLPLLPAMNSQRHSSSAESPSAPSGSGTAITTGDANGLADGKKRKAGDEALANGNASHTRAKRNRYISIACNECKRRKIKCNGNTPCQRCGNLNLECQYAPNCCSSSFRESDEFRQMNAHLNSLQEQVDALYANLNTLRTANGSELGFTGSLERSMSISQQSLPPISPMSRYKATHRQPSFRGPTSSAFSLDVAKNTLHNMGYQGLGDEGALTQDVTPIGSPAPIQHPSSVNSAVISSRDPLWTFSKDEMIRLCHVYEEEMGLMYPIANIDHVIAHGKTLHNYRDSSFRSGLASNGESGQGFNDLQTCILKMVLAAALVTEGNGRSDNGDRLFESVRGAADRLLHGALIDVKSLPFLVLVSIYHFHRDDEGLAWRIIGQVARMCIELGLHRRDSLLKVVPDPEERANAVKVFWSVYVLDRRWSFGTGMPFAMQDADIDPSLPEAEINIPYLNLMVSYSRIGSKVWRSICAFSPTPGPPLNVEEIGYLDYQIIQWQQSIPADLQFPTTSAAPTASRAVHRLQILLYLRANQMRMLIYRPVLHTASSIQEHMNYANTVVELAKDTIRALTHLNQTTDIYRCQQVCFNYFLISALAVVFLASCHAPVHFSVICRDEFYMALDLIKGFSNRSFVSKRLWRTIKGLKNVGPKLGLSPDVLGNGAMEAEDPHSSAALAMAGLAGHEISNLGNFGQDGMNGLMGTGNSPMNGFQMSHEMTNLFEAALGSVGMNGNANGAYAPLQTGDALTGIGSNIFGGDEELFKQLRDLF